MPAAASIMIRALCKTSARAMFSRKGVDTAANNSTTIAVTASRTRLTLSFMALSPLLGHVAAAAPGRSGAAIDRWLGVIVARTHNLGECDLACPENCERSSNSRRRKMHPGIFTGDVGHRLLRALPPFEGQAAITSQLIAFVGPQVHLQVGFASLETGSRHRPLASIKGPRRPLALRR